MTQTPQHDASSPQPARIEKIEVQGLFGLYNHTIPLNLDERVTVLYGVNGVGKTTILNLIEQVFGHPQRQQGQAERLEKMLRRLTRLSVYTVDGGELQLYHPRMGQRLPVQQNHNQNKIAAGQRSLLIQTHRLINLIPKSDQIGIINRSNITYTVNEYAQSLANMIKAATVQYGKDAQEIDQSFPLRALQAQPNKTLEDVRAIIQRYQGVQDALQRVNIFPANHAPPLPLNDTSPEKLAILYVHTEDSINKLAAFGDVAAKANTFLEMVNSRLIHKEMEISREAGFQIKNHAGKTIPLDSLSSGEQHQIVILFDLIFRTQAGALVLIDEPEISMHLSWQALFLRDLIRVAKMNQFDAIVATHSPAIIDKYWNLTVELKAEIAPDAEAAPASHA
jgi:predicted ATPase